MTQPLKVSINIFAIALTHNSENHRLLTLTSKAMEADKAFDLTARCVPPMAN